jgi:hypothetical protein
MEIPQWACTLNGSFAIARVTDIDWVLHAFSANKCHAAVPHRLPHLKPLKLWVIEIQRLVVPYPTMRCTEHLRFHPHFKGSTAFPNRVRSIESVILSFATFEKVKLYNPGTLSS